MSAPTEGTPGADGLGLAEAGAGATPDRSRVGGREYVCDLRALGRAVAALRWRTIWRGHDVALVYGGVVLVIGISLAFQQETELQRLVEESSTNLANLHHRPLEVLGLSAFVVSPALGLLILVPLVVCYGALQAWLGRASTIIIAILGHVGATLFIATLQATELTTNRVGMEIVRDDDVGVSYGLATVVGVLAARVPTAWRRRYLVASVVVMAVQLALVQGFTATGHITAWLVGLGLSVPIRRAAAAGPAAEPLREDDLTAGPAGGSARR